MNNFTHICPNCFADKQTATQCPSCGYEETLTEQNPLYLKPRTLLNQRYLIGNVIGHGGFGITYMSWDIKLERKVAIKEFLPTALATRTSETSDGKTKYTVTAIGAQKEAFKIGLKKFLKEAKILAGFTHENIVRVIDYFENHDTGYIVMEYVGQEDLSQFIKRQSEKRLTVAQALEIFFPILNALKVIHANGIYHQDISLQNIRIVDGNKPVLIDFGAARYIVGEMSQSVEKVFKPGYSPLEQITSRGKIGPWTDIYACGAMFYAMIVGELPPQSIDRLDQDDLISPDQKVEISPSVNDAVLKALSVRIGDRFQTAEEFETALKSPTLKANEKKRFLTAAAGVFLVVAIIVVGMIVVNPFGTKYRYTNEVPDNQPSELAQQQFELEQQRALLAQERERLANQKKEIEQRELVQKLRECQNHFQANSLAMAESGTALTCYQAVLKKHPNNTQALIGLKNIEARYITWAEGALNKAQRDQAKRYLARLRQVNPQSSQLAALEKRLSTLSSYRYVDNGDGTVTDNRSGLIWLKNANCFGKQDWHEAEKLVAKLAHGQCGLRDGSKSGMWRLPTKDEWEAMIDEEYSFPTLSNAAGTGKWKEEDAFSGVESSYYWSSTSYAPNASFAWFVNLGSGNVYVGLKSTTRYVWPVRGEV
jgi:serine/threonine protein kinase